MVDPKELARHFHGVIQEWLTRDEVTEVDLRNAQSADPKTCATHDFCDANMAMNEAAQRASDGMTEDDVARYLEQDSFVEVWNEAWGIAVRNGFARPWGKGTP